MTLDGFDPSQYASRSPNGGLVNLLNEGRNGKAAQSGQEDDLLSLASKRRSDTVKFTHYFLKHRLSEELDRTIQDHLDLHPEMKGETFVGIMTDGSFQTEVIPIKQAVDSVVDFAPEEAEKVLRENPVGYFSSQDFQVSTEGSGPFRLLKEKLDVFFQKNEDVFQYLRSNPDKAVDAEDLYSNPADRRHPKRL